MSGIVYGRLLSNIIRYTPRRGPYSISSLGNTRASVTKDLHTSSKCLCLVDGKGGNHKPTPFQRKVFVFTKVYASEAEIPERVTRSQMKNAMDKFRVRVSIIMVAMTAVFAAMMAFVGRKAKMDGQTITKISLARRQE